MSENLQKQGTLKIKPLKKKKEITAITQRIQIYIKMHIICFKKQKTSLKIYHGKRKNEE